jgi:hypothetical protein
MKRPAAWLSILLLAAAAGARPSEPFPPKGSYNNSVHRFFPDLDARLNAVRYGRWRALEIAWRGGINPSLDATFSKYLLELLKDPPRFTPEADRVAPRFAREALPVFHALHWGQVLEQEVIDVLASPDANPRLSEDRLNRVLDLYRRERWALTEPPETRSPDAIFTAAPVSARILSTGTHLLAAAAEDLAASDFGQQSWKVRQTVAEFDRQYAADRPPEEVSYRTAAPTIAERHPRIADHLDRISRFRAEVLGAMLASGETEAARQERSARLTEVARRYGIPASSIRAR